MSSVDPSAAVQTFGLVKRYSGTTRDLQGTGAQRQLRKIISLLSGSKERNLVALDNINLRLESGIIHGLLGPNGAGKTTLIKVLSTLILPDAGQAYVHGIDVVKRPRGALRILQTALSHETGFEWRLTGRQNLKLFGDLYDVPKPIVKSRIDELLSLLGVEEYADRTYNRYSTGTQKKFQVIRVLLADARVLIFDEPTSGLDVLAASEFRRILREVLVRQKGRTIIMASHNLWEVQQMCDRVVVLNNGRLVAEGATNEIRKVVSDDVNLSLVVEWGPGQSPDLVLARIREIDGLRKAETFSNQPMTISTIHLEGGSDFDYSKLFELVSELRLKVKSLESSNPTLEDAFIKLTQETSKN